MTGGERGGRGRRETANEEKGKLSDRKREEKEEENTKALERNRMKKEPNDK